MKSKITETANEDKTYSERARLHPAFLVCESLFTDLHDPPVITEKDMCLAFGKIMKTRLPPQIYPSQLKSLIENLGIVNRVKSFKELFT